MRNGSERKVPETAAATSFCIEDQGETERPKNRNCWQRIRSAFCHCFENLTDCLNFWFCKNECCNFCCTCDDYYEDDENERYGVAPALIKSQQNLEALTDKGIANEAVGTENEEFTSSLEIHPVSLDCGGGDGDFIGGNNSEKHSQVPVESQSSDEQSSGGQQSDHIGGGGDAENHSGVHQPSVSHHTNHGASDSGNNSGHHTSGGQHTNHGASDLGSDSGGHHPSVGHHTNHGASDSGNNSGHHTSGGQHTNHGASDLGSDSGGHHPSVGHHTNHGASDSGNNSGHHTSGGDYAVSDFGGGGDSSGGGWGGD